jgi:hypothetical protein
MPAGSAAAEMPSKLARAYVADPHVILVDPNTVVGATIGDDARPVINEASSDRRGSTSNWRISPLMVRPRSRHDTPWSMDELSAPLTCLSKKRGAKRMPKGKCMAGLKKSV